MPSLPDQLDTLVKYCCFPGPIGAISKWIGFDHRTIFDVRQGTNKGDGKPWINLLSLSELF